MLFHIGGGLIIIAASNIDVFKFTNFPVSPHSTDNDRPGGRMRCLKSNVTQSYILPLYIRAMYPCYKLQCVSYIKEEVQQCCCFQCVIYTMLWNRFNFGQMYSWFIGGGHKVVVCLKSHLFGLERESWRQDLGARTPPGFGQGWGVVGKYHSEDILSAKLIFVANLC